MMRYCKCWPAMLRAFFVSSLREEGEKEEYERGRAVTAETVGEQRVVRRRL